MKIDLLRSIDDRERIILTTVYQFQLEEPEGISWGELLAQKPIRREMSRQTFSHRIKGLIQKRLLEKEKVPLYRLNSKLFVELREFRERSYPWEMKRQIQEFEKDAESFDTGHFVEAMMELSFGILNTLAIALTCFETEGAKWLFYEATYQNIEQLLRGILNRASKSKEDKEQTLGKLFELLESFANRSIGKRFGLAALCNSKQEIIKTIVDGAGTRAIINQ